MSSNKKRPSSICDGCNDVVKLVVAVRETVRDACNTSEKDNKDLLRSLDNIGAALISQEERIKKLEDQLGKLIIHV